MRLEPKLEEIIKNEAIALLQDGRAGWDVRHTLTVVKWIRELIKNEHGDEKTLVPAAYFHDTSYPELKKGYSHSDVMAIKLGHAERAAQNVQEFFSILGYFTFKEIERIAYLVANHDKHDNITDHDRQLLFEADGLAQIDWLYCPPSYNKKNCIEFLDTYYERRKQFMRTKTGLAALARLEKSAREYLEKME